MPFYERAKEIARNTLTLGYANVKLQNALYFHSQKVNPAWNEDKVVITKIGDHVFYSDK